MFKLGVDLQEGFTNAHVTMRVDGTEVFDEGGVQTVLLTGLAAAFELEVEGGATTLDVTVRAPQLPVAGLHKVIPLTISGDTYVGVSVSGDAIATIVRHEPFGYG